jgi:hypothetical protein
LNPAAATTGFVLVVPTGAAAAVERVGPIRVTQAQIAAVGRCGKTLEVGQEGRWQRRVFSVRRAQA